MSFTIFITSIVIIILIAKNETQLRDIWRRSGWLYKRKTIATTNFLDHQYVEGKAFYMYKFGKLPSLTYIEDIDITMAFAHLQDSLQPMIKHIHQCCFFNREAGKQEFTRTLFVLNNQVIIELYREYAEIFYTERSHSFVDQLIKELSQFKAVEKKNDFEINIITLCNNSLELKALDIKPTELDIALYYREDFKEVDQTIRERLSRSNDKGIILLHGLPGTGKTTYLRHLIGGLTKKVLFVSPAVAGNLMNPEFIDLLIDNPNAVLVIEDAEQIILDRKYNSHSSVSNLLNLSDGLLSDCLNVQIICTFNNDLAMVDSALLRKGRLIAQYEFGRLTKDGAQQLSDHLGFKTVITEPMTIAEIAHQHEKIKAVKKVEVIGFRRNNELVN